MPLRIGINELNADCSVFVDSQQMLSVKKKSINRQAYYLHFHRVYQLQMLEYKNL